MRALLVAMLFTCTLAAAQQAPKKDRVETVLLVTDACSRALDLYSTHRMLAQSNHEMIMPREFVSTVPALTAYEAGSTALNYLVARRLEHRGHRRLARIVTSIDIGEDMPWAVHNLFLPNYRKGAHR